MRAMCWGLVGHAVTLLCGSALAQGLEARCQSPSRALQVQVEGLFDEQRRAVEAEVEVEAARLGLVACREAGAQPARVSARLARTDQGMHLEAETAGRRLTRDVEATPGTTGALELAVVLGDLVQELLHPTVDAAPAGPRFLGELRAAGESYPSGHAWLLGGDLAAQVRWARVGLELLVSGRFVPPVGTGLGSVRALGVGGGLAVLVSVLQAGPVELMLLAGARAQALQLAGTPSGDAAGRAVWAPVVEARGGVRVELAAGPVAFELGLEVTGAALGALATAAGSAVTGPMGLGGAATLGVVFPRRPR